MLTVPEVHSVAQVSKDPEQWGYGDIRSRWPLYPNVTIYICCIPNIKN